MLYTTPEPNDIDYLRRVTAPARVLCGAQISEDYSHDELGGIRRKPDVLVRIESTEEAAAILRHANARRIPVVVRGSGTGLVGAGVPIEGGIMLETTGMNRILELDEDNLTLTVQPGVLLMDIAAFTEARGFLYPPDPGEKSATIGGNISTNAGGMRAVKYGVTRDYVRGLTAVLPTGEVVRLGGKVVKNSTGYSLKDLLIGSEGTLAVITEAILKLTPLPQLTVSLLLPFESIQAAIETVPALVRSRCALTAIEFMERDTIRFAEDYLGKRFPHTSAPAYLLLTADGGDADTVERQIAAAAELCIRHGAWDAFIVDTEERKNAVWSARGAFLEAIRASTPELDECDVVVPRDQVAAFILYTHEVRDKLGVRIPSFGHAGDGNLHVYVCRDALDDADWQRIVTEAFDLLYAKARSLGGLVSGEHGVGYAKRAYMASACGEAQLALMRRIKAAFDPNDILNPGKVI